jgi:hypothetical protein
MPINDCPQELLRLSLKKESEVELGVSALIPTVPYMMLNIAGIRRARSLLLLLLASHKSLKRPSSSLGNATMCTVLAPPAQRYQ